MSIFATDLLSNNNKRFKKNDKKNIKLKDNGYK